LAHPGRSADDNFVQCRFFTFMLFSVTVFISRNAQVGALGEQLMRVFYLLTGCQCSLLAAQMLLAGGVAYLWWRNRAAA
jgi:hypothetical protein